MKAENFENFQLEGFTANFTRFQELFVRQEKKVEPLLLEPNILHSDLQKKIKKKGRPKTLKKDFLTEKNQLLDDSRIDRHKGHWSNEENKKYHLFLELHHLHFIQRQMRRVDKIFKSMASYIKTREAEQCRSHHQKMEKKHQTFAKILLYLRRSHYGSQNQEFVKNDLQSQGFEIEKLISPEQLVDLDKDKKQHKLEKSQMLGMSEIEKMPDILELEKKVSFENLLQDHYENEFGLQFLN